MDVASGPAGGIGIRNDSSNRPKFTIIPEFGGISFNRSATAANAVINNFALVNFFGTSTAGNATITTDTVLTDDGNEFNFNVTNSGIPNVFVVAEGEGKKQ